MQRIFVCGKTQHINITLDKILN